MHLLVEGAGRVLGISCTAAGVGSVKKHLELMEDDACVLQMVKQLQVFSMTGHDSLNMEIKSSCRC